MQPKTIASIVLGGVILILIGVLVYAAIPGKPCGSAVQASCPMGKFCAAQNTCASCPSGSGTNIPNCPTLKCPFNGVSDCWMNTRGVGPADLTIMSGVSGHNPSYYGGWNVTGPEDAISLCKSVAGCQSIAYTPVGPSPDGKPTGPAVWLFKSKYQDTDPSSKVRRYAGDGTTQYPTPYAGSLTANIVK